MHSYFKLERRNVTTSERFFYSPFTKACYRANSDNEEGIYSCIDSIDSMGGVVSARKAQYFEPKYESKPSARVAPGRTGSDIFPDKKASAPAAAAPPQGAGTGSELYTILCKLTAKPGKGAEVYRYFQEKLMPIFQKEPDTLVYACHVQADTPDIIWIYETYTSKAAFEKHGKIYTKKAHAELEALLTGPPEDIVMKPAAIHKGLTQRLV